MKLKIEIELENDAFVPSPDTEAKRILTEFMRQTAIGTGMPPYSLRDINGNRVGQAWIEL